MVAATLCGITDPKKVKRSMCAMGHKWMWNRALGGLPPEEFLAKVDPLLAGVREKLDGEYATSDEIAGYAYLLIGRSNLGLKPAFRFRWAPSTPTGTQSAPAAAPTTWSTSSALPPASSALRRRPIWCRASAEWCRGACIPNARELKRACRRSGDIFNAIATRAGSDVQTLSKGLEKYRAGQTGLLRMTWDNGDRTVLVNPNLRGITLGWNLQSTAQDELFAAIEGTAFHSRVIFDRMAEHGVEVKRVINGGGIPQKNDVLNQVYANVLGCPVLVPSKSVVSLGSAIFAFLAAGAFKTVEEAQDKIGPSYKTYQPEKSEKAGL